MDTEQVQSIPSQVGQLQEFMTALSHGVNDRGGTDADVWKLLRRPNMLGRICDDLVHYNDLDRGPHTISYDGTETFESLTTTPILETEEEEASRIKDGELPPPRRPRPWRFVDSISDVEFPFETQPGEVSLAMLHLGIEVAGKGILTLKDADTCWRHKDIRKVGGFGKLTSGEHGKFEDLLSLAAKVTQPQTYMVVALGTHWSYEETAHDPQIFVPALCWVDGKPFFTYYSLECVFRKETRFLIRLPKEAE